MIVCVIEKNKMKDFVQQIFHVYKVQRNGQTEEISPLSVSPTKWSNTFNNSSATAAKLFECI